MKSIFTLGLLGLAAAAPVLNKRVPQEGEAESADSKVSASAEVDDVIIAQYALTLEHLEDAFYEQALKNFTEEDFKKAVPEIPDLFKNVKDIAADEKTHVEFLTTALESLKQTPVKRCTYSFPVTDVASMAAVANLLEGVGVSAYLGAAGFIADKTILGAAASIATIEGRHSSFLRGAVKQAPFPNAFDVPLDFNPVFSLASAFITGCPSDNPPLPFKAFPPLQIANDGPFAAHTDIAFDIGELEVDESRGCPNIAFFVPGTGPVFEPATVVSSEGRNIVSCKIPKEAAGQVYAVMTYDSSKADDSTIVAGPAIVEARPSRGH